MADLTENETIKHVLENVRCAICAGRFGRVSRPVLVRAVQVADQPATPGEMRVRLTLRCLGCGVMTGMDLTLEAQKKPEIQADEVLDLHEALEGDEWWSQLTGRR